MFMFESKNLIESYQEEFTDTEYKKQKKFNYYTVNIEVREIEDSYAVFVDTVQDPNIYGYVIYQSKDKAIAAYDALESKGYIMDYLHRNSKEIGNAIQWYRIVLDELRMSMPDYDKNGVNIKLSMEDEMDTVDDVNDAETIEDIEDETV